MAAFTAIATEGDGQFGTPNVSQQGDGDIRMDDMELDKLDFNKMFDGDDRMKDIDLDAQFLGHPNQNASENNLDMRKQHSNSSTTLQDDLSSHDLLMSPQGHQSGTFKFGHDGAYDDAVPDMDDFDLSSAFAVASAPNRATFAPSTVDEHMSKEITTLRQCSAPNCRELAKVCVYKQGIKVYVCHRHEKGPSRPHAASFERIGAKGMLKRIGKHVRHCLLVQSYL